jgi:MFS transporter, DHA2 family, multidrug resistance protein
VLTGFVAWERRQARHPSAQPLVDLTLFRSASFTWGSILITLVTFALFGILFAMPQYFQDVRGLDAFGSGLRLLFMIGGLVVGMLGGTRLQSPRRGPGDLPGRALVSAKWLITAGFTVMAAALAVGTATRVATASGYTATWFAFTGLGLGLALPAAMNAAMGALTADHSGAGSALISAMRQVGGTIGVAILGTVLGSAYRSHLDVSGVPHPAAGIARSSVAGGMAVARGTGSAPLLDEVRTAFVHALDAMLWVCAGIAVAAALLALAFLPRPRPDELAASSQAPQPAQITS